MSSAVPSRRELFGVAAALGFGTTTFHRAVAAEALQPVTAVTAEMVEKAEWVAGITLTDDQRKQAATALTRTVRDAALMHKVEIGNHVAPALHFVPNPGQAPSTEGRGTVALAPQADAKKPAKGEDLAFLPLAHLAELVRTKQVTSTELTKRLDPTPPPFTG